ncbi:hypothetical protein B0O80DRAFT_531528 [Mortierella sp. GBAus27b]|nr:hypothetical protein B0O80DRAFT_531528 [Mortierella sp. GBAus27b]
MRTEGGSGRTAWHKGLKNRESSVSGVADIIGSTNLDIIIVAATVYERIESATQHSSRQSEKLSVKIESRSDKIENKIDFTCNTTSASTSGLQMTLDQVLNQLHFMTDFMSALEGMIKANSRDIKALESCVVLQRSQLSDISDTLTSMKRTRSPYRSQLRPDTTNHMRITNIEFRQSTPHHLQQTMSFNIFLIVNPWLGKSHWLMENDTSLVPSAPRSEMFIQNRRTSFIECQIGRMPTKTHLDVREESHEGIELPNWRKSSSQIVGRIGESPVVRHVSECPLDTKTRLRHARIELELILWKFSTSERRTEMLVSNVSLISIDDHRLSFRITGMCT